MTPTIRHFYCTGASLGDLPSGPFLRVGKQIGEDPITNRAAETLGYVVIEAGAGVLSGVPFWCGLTDPSIDGMDNAPPHTYDPQAGAAIEVAVATGNKYSSEGVWAVLYGVDPVHTNALHLAGDEDQLGDTERSLYSRVMSYALFGTNQPTRTAAAHFACAESSGLESDHAPVVSVRMSPPPTTTATVEYRATTGSATGGGVDYTLRTGTLTFPPLSTEQFISFDVFDDADGEGMETIELELRYPTNCLLGPRPVHTYGILDNDRVFFATNSSASKEHVSPIQLTVLLANPETNTVTVDYAASGGTATGGGVDYTLDAGTLTFAPGSTSQGISITIHNDDVEEDDETIEVSLISAQHAEQIAPLTHTYTIQASDRTIYTYSTYLGGSRHDYGRGIAVDTAGCAYVVGRTESLDFPIASAFQPSKNTDGDTMFTQRSDAFLVKFSADGSTLLYATYLGGSDDEYPEDVAVDTNGSAYVVGYTWSTDFPLQSAIQPAHAGRVDVFVARFSPDGTMLDYATFLGGTWDDLARRITVDEARRAYIVGETGSSSFPMHAAYQSTPGGSRDAFVSVVSGAGTNLLFSSYLGGSSYDAASDVVVDGEGGILITGLTGSTNYPIANAYQASLGGSYDYVLSRFDPDWTNLSFSTYLGGTGQDRDTAVAMDEEGFIYLAGSTASTNLPLQSPLQGTHMGGYDIYYAKFTPGGDEILFAGYLGGSDHDWLKAAAVDKNGALYLAGETDSFEFPQVFPLQAPGVTPTYRDGFVAKISVVEPAVLFSSYIGATRAEDVEGLCVDQHQSIYVVGSTEGHDFPTYNAFQPTRQSWWDAFVMKIGQNTVRFDAAASSGPESETNVTVRVALAWAHSYTVTVDYAVSGGTATGGGVDYTLAAGTLTFVPGSTSEFVQVAVSDDRMEEPAEQVEVGLSNPSYAVLGTPDAHTYTIRASDSITLTYASYLGGSAIDLAYDVAVDTSGAMYVVGMTQSTNFPLAQPFQSTIQAATRVGFVTKCDATGTNIVYSTYLGGIGNDRINAVEVDEQGAAYVSGKTASTNFPVRSAFRDTYTGGTGEAFVSKLHPAGTGLVYSTYLGSTADEEAMDLALHTSGTVYVVGYTAGTNFPTQLAIQSTSGGGWDIFATHISSNGQSLLFSTYLGGPNYESAVSVGLDGSDAVYLSGWNMVGGFPVTTNGVQPSYGGGSRDALTVKLFPGETGIVYATYLGGAGMETVPHLIVDDAGIVYLCGSTDSSDFPTASPLQPSHAGGTNDAFITALSAEGTNMLFSTYLGGGGLDFALCAAQGPDSNIYIAGFSGSVDFPTLSGSQEAYGGGTSDGFVAKIAPDGSSMSYGSYIGGSAADEINGLVVDPFGVAIVAGHTYSVDFPTVSPFQASAGGSVDAFVAKISRNALRFAHAASSGEEHVGSTNLEVRLDNPAYQAVTVAYSADGGTAIQGIDYALGAGVLTFQPGVTSQVIHVTVLEDTLDEADETLRVRLHDPTFAGVGSPEIHTYTIEANDAIVMTYGSCLGGAAADVAHAIAVDHEGTIYLAGETSSTNFPLAGPMQGTGGGFDAFVSKLSPEGTSLVYATYVGGADDDRAYDMDVDAAGAVYLVGETVSTNFPLASAIYGTSAGGWDAFVSKIAADGGSLVYSTYVGGETHDGAFGIAVNALGGAHVVGYSASTNFPLVSALQTTYGGGSRDAFVTKVTPGGTALDYSTYLGGHATDEALAVTVDEAGQAYVAGGTSSTNFPTMAALEGTLQGMGDAFVAKLDATGSNLVYGTYFGGGKADKAYAIALGTLGSIYVAGETYSSDLPVLSAYQASYAGSQDAFLFKLSESGTNLLQAGYFGGSASDRAHALAVDGEGAVYLAGVTASTNYPIVLAIQDAHAGPAGGDDAFVTKVLPSGDTLGFSTYVGGTSNDHARALAVASRGAVYFAGQTHSPDFPLKLPYQGTHGSTDGSSDAFVARLRQVAVYFEKLNSSGLENEPNVTIAVELSEASGRPVTVDYLVTGGSATGGGVDYTLASGPLTFAPGQTLQHIQLSVIDDGVHEESEALELTLHNTTNAVLGAPSVHTYRIDPYEPNDDVDIGKYANPTLPQVHTFHTTNDADWTKFYAVTNYDFTVAADTVSTNIDIALDVYRQLLDGSLVSMISTDTNGFGGAESGDLLAPTNDLYFIRISQVARADAEKGAYTLRIEATEASSMGARGTTAARGSTGPAASSGSGSLFLVIGYDEVTRGPLPAGSYAVLDGVTNYFPGDPSVSYAGIGAGVHTVSVYCAHTGFLAQEDPALPGQVENIDNAYYGNPRIAVVTNDAEPTSLGGYAAFAWVPTVEVKAQTVVRDDCTSEERPGASILFEATGGHIKSNHVLNGHVYNTSYKTLWYTQPDGSFPTNVMLPATNAHLTLTLPGYSNAVVDHAISNVSAGDVIDLGTLYMAKLFDPLEPHLTNLVFMEGEAITDGDIALGALKSEIHFWSQAGIETPPDEGPIAPPSYSLVNPSGMALVTGEWFESFTRLDAGRTIVAKDRQQARPQAEHVELGPYTLRWSATSSNGAQIAGSFRGGPDCFLTQFDVLDDDTNAPSPPTNVVVLQSGWTNVNTFHIQWDASVDETGIAEYRVSTQSIPPTALSDGTVVATTGVLFNVGTVVQNANFEDGPHHLQVPAAPATTNGWTFYGPTGTLARWEIGPSHSGIKRIEQRLEEGAQPSGLGRYALIGQDFTVDNTNQWSAWVTFHARFLGDLDKVSGGDLPTAFLKVEFYDANTSLLHVVDNEFDTDHNGAPGDGIYAPIWQRLTLTTEEGPPDTEIVRLLLGIAQHDTAWALTGYWDSVDANIQLYEPNGTVLTNVAEGVITNWLFAVDADRDRTNDQRMSDAAAAVTRYDPVPPEPVVLTNLAPGPDIYTELEIGWNPLPDGGREDLAPWETYRVYYTRDDRDAAYGDPYFDIFNSGAIALGTNTTCAIVLSNLIFGETYRVSVVGRDQAGNESALMPSWSATLPTFETTQAMAVVDASGQVQGVALSWTAGADTGTTYDLLYTDAASYDDALWNQWQLLETVTNGYALDTGSPVRLPPQELNGLVRFYRVAPHGRWQVAQSNPIAGQTVYAACPLRLSPGQNFVSLFLEPDDARVGSVLGTSVLPASSSIGNATKLTWHAASTNAAATNVIWLTSAGVWWWNHGGGGIANEKEIPLTQGFNIDIPPHVINTQTVLIVGRIPETPYTETVLPGRRFNVLGYTVPRRTKLQDLNLVESGFAGGPNRLASDELRVLRRGGGSTTAPLLRAWYDTGNGTWKSTSGATLDDTYLEPGDAIVIYTKQSVQPFTWTNTLHYAPPSKFLKP